MIDLHCHLLPAVDDGPPDLDVALALARAQLVAGVDTVAATPHVSATIPTDAATVARGLRELRGALERAAVPLTVVSGAEVELTRALELPDEELRALTLDGGRWLLLEAPFAAFAPLEPGVAALQERGFSILLAHPERSLMVQRDPAAVRRLVDRGVRTQVTAMALTGRFGRGAQRLASRLLDDGLVHVVASDAHDPLHRPPGLREPLEQTGLVGAVERLCHEHPRALLAGEPLPGRVRLARRRRRLRLRRL